MLISVHVYACVSVHRCVCVHVCECVCVSCQWQRVAIAPRPEADFLPLNPCVCCSSVTLPWADFLSSSTWASVSLSPEESWFSAYWVVFRCSSLICWCSKYHDQTQLRAWKGFISSYTSRSQAVIESSQNRNRCRSCGGVLLVGFTLLLMLIWPNCVRMVPSTVAWTFPCKPSIKTMSPNHRQIWWQQWLNWGSLSLVSLRWIKLTITNQCNHQLVLRTIYDTLYNLYNCWHHVLWHLTCVASSQLLIS